MKMETFSHINRETILENNYLLDWVGYDKMSKEWSSHLNFTYKAFTIYLIYLILRYDCQDMGMVDKWDCIWGECSNCYNFS